MSRQEEQQVQRPKTGKNLVRVKNKKRQVYLRHSHPEEVYQVIIIFEVQILLLWECSGNFPFLSATIIFIYVRMI